jgi:geranylgeranyl pyrophosphate synthase
MTTPIAPQSSTSLKQILAPVAEDIARIDDVLRSITTLEFPVVRHGIEAIIAAGGKRLRPAVLFLAARFHNYDVERLVAMAAAIELLHTASLVHDDTIDNALIRRGLPTLNAMIDEGTTVLVGDYLFAKSAVLSTMGGVLRATRIFAESLVTISEGEIEQKFATHHLTANMEQYYKRIYSKTAVLFAAAGEIGAVISEAPEDEVQRLREYGRQVGMAFQIVDDILDFRATEEQLGKPVGGDLRQGTVTLPVMFYLENASAEERETIRRVVEGDGLTEERLATAISRINESGAVERASRIANRFVEEAKASVLGFEDNEARRSLLSLADFAVSRSF